MPGADFSVPMVGATRSGLYTRFGILYISCAILMFIVSRGAVFASATLVAWSSDSTADEVGYLLVGLSPFWVSVPVVSSLPLVSIGSACLCLGRSDPGGRHLRNLNFALAALSGSGFLYLLSGLFGLFAAFQCITSAPIDCRSPAYAGLWTLSAALSVLAAALLGLFLRWSVVVFLGRRLRGLSVTALAIGVVASFLAGATVVADRSGLFVVPGTGVWAVVSVMPELLWEPVALASLGLWFAIYATVLVRFREERREAGSRAVADVSTM